ncbi:hypothetical protein ig2599ANME_0130 [groundwater metagenome]
MPNLERADVRKKVQCAAVKPTKKLGCVYRWLDNVFGYNGKRWVDTLFMSIIFAIPTLWLYSSLTGIDLKPGTNNNKFAVAAIGLPVFLVMRKLYWLHRRSQIIAFLDAGEYLHDDMFSIMMAHPDMHREIAVYRENLSRPTQTDTIQELL